MAVSTVKNNAQQSSIKRILVGLMGKLGRIGKALLFPIAMLPLAAIMLRVGAQLPNGTEFAHFVNTIFLAIGNAVFEYLPILFAIGVGFALTKESRGEAAISAFIGMILLTLLMKSTSGGGADIVDQIYGKTGSQDFHTIFKDKYDKILSGNVLNGIIAGGICAAIYNRFNGAELPKVLGFFSGKRLIPVLSLLGVTIFGLAYALVFPWIGFALNGISEGLGDATGNRWSNASIQAIYLFFNRLLIPFGLHHIPNTLFWFSLGSHPSASTGEMINGDINIFLKGASEGNTAGTFQSGFFPMMMFGLPALVAAMWFTAEKDQRVKVISMLGGSALISFLTGITEPIEFTFMFVSPLLYVVHAVLGAIFAFITGVFGIQLGFGFSAGLFDYLLSIPKSMSIISANKTGADAAFANPGWLVVIGLACALSYFFVGVFVIKKFNLSTPGRGTNLIADEKELNAGVDVSGGGLSSKAAAIVKGLGGYKNITSFSNCITRLRYDVVDSSKVNAEALKKAGALGTIIVSKTHVQVIVGQVAEIMNNEIKDNRYIEEK